MYSNALSNTTVGLALNSGLYDGFLARSEKSSNSRTATPNQDRPKSDVTLIVFMTEFFDRVNFEKKLN